MKKLSMLTFTAILNPVLAFAQTGGANLSSLISLIMYYLNLVLYLIMAIAVVLFVFYVVKYFMADSGEKRREGGLYIMYAVIGFFVVLSFWGIVNIVQNTFGLGNNYYAPRSWSSFGNLFPNSSGSRTSTGGNSVFNTGTNLRNSNSSVNTPNAVWVNGKMIDSRTNQPLPGY
jgi:glucan phosphoethanolaminetransferase (alkaline phosphatase superfamily)